MVVSAGIFSRDMGQFDLNRRTKIVATIGPATESPERIKELVKAGATTFRLNFSHGDHSEHAARIATIRQVSEELGRPSASSKTFRARRSGSGGLLRGRSPWPTAIRSRSPHGR